MAIDHERGGLAREELLVEREIAAKIVVRGRIFEIALVLREHGRAVHHEAERRLEFRTEREKIGRALEAGRQRDRFGRVTARAPQHARLAGHDARHGIVDAVRDRTVVVEHVVRDAGQPLARIGVVDYLRLARTVAARHDDRPSHAAQ